MGDCPSLYQINCSPGGVPKLPVPEAWVSVEGVNGDGHRNRILHGGPDRALCLYAYELIEALQREGHTIYPGAAGENLTIVGLDWKQLKPGDHLNIGKDVQIELTAFCEPCRHNARWFRGENYLRISQQHYPGWSRVYARVLSEGSVRQGDRVRGETVPGRRLK